MKFHKSKVYGVSVSEGEISNCAQVLGCETTSLPFKYLGVLMGLNLDLKRNWILIIERVQNKLSSWKSKALSFRGRVSLIKAVLGSLLLFYFSNFKALNFVLEFLERCQKRFLWSGDKERNRIHWVAWKVVLAPKEKGGLGSG